MSHYDDVDDTGEQHHQQQYDGVYYGTDDDCDDANPTATATTTTSNNRLLNETITTTTTVNTVIDYLVDNEDDNYEDLRDGDDSNSDYDCDDENPAAKITTTTVNTLIDYLVDNKDDDTYEDLRDADFDDRIDNSKRIDVLNVIVEEESQDDQTNTSPPLSLYDTINDNDNNHNNDYNNSNHNNNNDSDSLSKINNLMEQFESDLLELKSDMSIQFGTNDNTESKLITVPLSTISSVVTTIAPTPTPAPTPKATPTEYTTNCETPTRTIAITKEDDADLDKELHTIEYISQADKYQYEATTNLGKNHSQNHTIQIQETSSLSTEDYVTWNDTLHPENADSIIDQRLCILSMYLCLLPEYLSCVLFLSLSHSFFSFHYQILINLDRQEK